jgi:putative oxidoreductase
MDVGRFLLRLCVGGFFVGHGTQKLFGWFGGGGLDASASGFESMGMRPGRRNALAAGVAEAGGGALLIAGTETPLAASVLTATMLTAIHRVHGKNGPWNSKGGYEYNAVLIAAVTALAELGPGSFSLDSLRGHVRAGRGWALASLGLGAAGAAGAYLLSEWSGPSEPVASDVSPVASDAGGDPVPTDGASPAQADSAADA